jgi:hypothetical protein
MNTILSFLLAAAAAAAPSTPSSIDALCDPLAKYARQKENVPKIFADLSDPQKDQTPRWTLLKDKGELDRRAKEDDVYTQAFVWKQDSGTFVLMFFTSPSGDWAEYDDYCYRLDGSLARSVSTLNTFNVNAEEDDEAPVSRIRTKYFSPDNRLLRSRTRVLNTKTRKPTKVSFIDQDESVFRTIGELPFAALLRRGLTGR